MNIINPQFSFVQFTDGASPADCDYLIPLALNGDLKFQVIISTAGDSESSAVAGASQKLYVVKSGAVITDETTLSANTLLTQTSFFTPTQIISTQVLLCWYFGLNNLQTLADNTCFRLCLRLTNGSTVLYFLSNCFQKISDTKYYNTLEYYCTSDNYGFTYCEGCTNKIRLPFYLGGPQVKEDQTAYVYSNGNRKLTKYQAGKIFEVKIGTVPEDIHNKITTALAHDVVNIESPRYTGGIRKDGDYTIAWDRPEDLTAPAATKAYATPYIVISDNCAECIDFVPCVGVQIPAFVFDHATQDVAYSKSITVTGDAPYSFTNIVKPSWLTSSVSGATITFSGTPGSGDVGTGIVISFDVLNACGSASASKTIDVTATPCTAVGVTGTPALPDGSVGAPYDYSFTLTGDSPFTLSSIVKPSWMTVDIQAIYHTIYYEYKVHFYGTPDTEGTAIAVSCTVNNCSGDTYDFSDTMDVSATVLKNILVINDTSSYIALQFDSGSQAFGPGGSGTIGLTPGGYLKNTSGSTYMFTFLTALPSTLDADETPNSDTLLDAGIHTLNADLTNLNYIEVHYP